MSDGSRIETANDQPGIGYVVRLYWMLFGNVALFFASLNVVASERLGRADVIYGALTLSLLLARWVDITKLNGMTTRAQPATRADLRRYAIGLLGCALLGWIIARLLSPLGP